MKIFRALIANLYQKVENLYWNNKYQFFREKYSIHPSFRFNGKEFHFMERVI